MQVRIVGDNSYIHHRLMTTLRRSSIYYIHRCMLHTRVSLGTILPAIVIINPLRIIRVCYFYVLSSLGRVCVCGGGGGGGV